MEKLNKEIGSRLRKVREIMNEGGKLSAEQFAYLLGETRDKIVNYESGRAALPVRVLLELYNRGISPEFIISGSGSIFADSKIGKEFEQKVLEKQNRAKKYGTDDVKILQINNKNADNINIEIKTAAAGKININKDEN